jgi:hypothetical protein
MPSITIVPYVLFLAWANSMVSDMKLSFRQMLYLCTFWESKPESVCFQLSVPKVDLCWPVSGVYHFFNPVWALLTSGFHKISCSFITLLICWLSQKYNLFKKILNNQVNWITWFCRYQSTSFPRYSSVIAKWINEDSDHGGREGSCTSAMWTSILNANVVAATVECQ